DVREPLESLRRGAAHHPVDLVALLEKQLGQVAAVLTRDAGYQSAFAHQAASARTRSRHQSSVSASVLSSGISGRHPVAPVSSSFEPRMSITSCSRTRAGSVLWSTSRSVWRARPA